MIINKRRDIILFVTTHSDRDDAVQVTIGRTTKAFVEECNAHGTTHVHDDGVSTTDDAVEFRIVLYYGLKAQIDS